VRPRFFLKRGHQEIEGPTKFKDGHQPEDRQGARPIMPATLLARADEVIDVAYWHFSDMVRCPT